MVGIVGTLAIPVILPHTLHGYHIAHILLHVGGLVLAIFISTLAWTAYSRMKTKRMLYTSFAFSIFIIAEGSLLFDSTWPSVMKIGSIPLTEIGHILTFATLGLLAIGVFKND